MRDEVSARTYYNLACSDAAQGEGKTALDDLRKSLSRTYGNRRAELIRWATKDPSLAELRESADYGSQFSDLLDRYTIPEPAAKPAPVARPRAKTNPRRRPSGKLAPGELS